MKKIIFWIIFIIILIIGFIIATILITRNKEPKEQNIDISYCSYNESGDSLGGHYSIRYYKETNKIIITERETHNSEEEITEYLASEECISKLKEILGKSNYKKWSSYKYSEVYALDAATSSISVTINGEDYSLHQYQKKPSKEKNIIGEIHNILSQVIGN